MTIAAVACAGAAVVLLIALLALRGGGGRPSGTAANAELAWEQQHHDQIIALKGEAESLAIAGKLAESHAKYRALETLLSGRTIKDARLFDLVDQARVDQSRVYALILQKMGTPSLNAPLAPASTSESGAAETEPDAATPMAPPASARAAATEPAEAPATQPLAVAMPPAPASTAAPPMNEAPPPSESTASAPTTDAVAGREFPPQPASSSRITDAMVGAAIAHGVDFLLAQFHDGEIPGAKDSPAMDAAGLDALAVYSLLQCGRAIPDPRLSIKGGVTAIMLDKLRDRPINTSGAFNLPITYARSLRACALATFNRPMDRKQLQADVRWLIRAADQGAYSYDDRWANERSDARRRFDPLDVIPPAPTAPKNQFVDAPDGSAHVIRFADAPSSPPRLVLLHNGEILPSPVPPPPPPTIMPPRPQPTFRNTLPPRRYDPGPKYKSPFPWDNSNSQYGLLGVWAGAEVGVEVPERYWRDVQRHWTSCQLPTGEWNYGGGDKAGYFSMTVAGIASLFVTHDYLDAPLLGRSSGIGRDPYSVPLSAGLAWLESGDNCVDILKDPRQPGEGIRYRGYSLFGLERVGLASGFKHFGSHDWFLELTTAMLAQQFPDGSWHGEFSPDAGVDEAQQQREAIIDTAYTLLFLARGRHPVMINKLRFNDFWTNRPRDIANLAAYASRELERPLNWQVVDILREPEDWADSPILYLASNRPPKMDDQQVQKLAAFVQNGGLLFTHADLNAEPFNAWARQLAKRLFPDYELKDLPAQHPLYTLNYKITLPRPRLMGVSNGARLLMVHSTTDLANAWQQRATVSRKEAFQLGANLYLYATGKERFRNRLDTPVVPDPPTGPAPQIDLAQLRYGGNWQPEPGAWLRFARQFQNQTGTRLVTRPAAATELDPSKFLIVLLTGTDARVPSDTDATAVAKFITGGGTLLVDACGGSGEFATGIEAWLAKLGADAGGGAGGGALRPLAPNDPLLKQTVPGSANLGPEQLRLYAVEQLGREGNRLKTMTLGKGRVIYSPLDITSGLLDTNTWGILGYSPQYAQALATNIILTVSAAAK
jgi:hypothetical protein